MNPRLRWSRKAGIASLAAATSAMLAGTAISATPAHAAPDPDCPAAYPVASLSANQSVTGKTVTQGTTPSTFTGTVQGVLEDGLAPGYDVIVADLDSPTIERAGIWEGMSGSPVYASDGRLIGAVSETFAFGASTIAGITPAADMYKLIDGGVNARAQAGHKIALPASLARRLVARGSASQAQVSGGLRELPLTWSLAGPSAAQMTKMAHGLRIGGRRVRAAAAPASSEQIPVTVGGNLGVSVSYGTILAGAQGTATMVCGDQVVGFGHPAQFSGPSTMSLHGARTLEIQADPTGPGYPLSNFGAPVGVVDQDRQVGVVGEIGATPTTFDIRATASAGGASSTGVTHVTQQDAMPDLSFAHLYTIQQRAIDRVGAGGAYGTYTIRGTRRDGTPFSMTRRNRWADPYDIAEAPAEAAAEDVYSIQDNPGEAVKITSVTANTHLSRDSATYVIARVEVRFRGRWVTARRNEPVAVHAGSTAQLRVTLRSRDLATHTVRMQVKVPTHATGRSGLLKVVGGDQSVEDSEDFFDEGDFFDTVPVPRPSTLPKLLASLESAQQNNEIRATVRFRRAPGTASAPRTGSTTISHVVEGYDVFPVVAVK